MGEFLRRRGGHPQRHGTRSRGRGGEEERASLVPPGHGQQHGRGPGGGDELDRRLEPPDHRREVPEEEGLEVPRGEVGEAHPAVDVGCGEPGRAPEAVEAVAEDGRGLA